jgi:hypothetical protein
LPLVAVFPGVSRSRRTVTTGLALGLKRETAALFVPAAGAHLRLRALGRVANDRQKKRSLARGATQDSI